MACAARNSSSVAVSTITGTSHAERACHGVACLDCLGLRIRAPSRLGPVTDHRTVLNRVTPRMIAHAVEGDGVKPGLFATPPAAKAAARAQCPLEGVGHK